MQVLVYLYPSYLASIACAFAGLAYAEYASMVPVAGSAYAYTYASLGEFLAFIVGWNLIFGIHCYL